MIPDDLSPQARRLALTQFRDAAARLGLRPHISAIGMEALDAAIAGCEEARRPAPPVFRWLREDLFEIGPEGAPLRIPRPGADLFALALTQGAEHANRVVLMRPGSVAGRGNRLRHQRQALALWLEAEGYRDVAAAVRRVQVAERTGRLSVLAPRL